MIRFTLLAFTALALAGCASVFHQEEQAPPPPHLGVAEITEKARTTAEECRAQFSESRKDAVARGNCFNDVDDIFKQIAKFPDLVDRRIAKRTELAKEIADGKITRARAVAQFTELSRVLVGEEHRRLKSKVSASVQQSAALAGARLF